MRSIRFVSLSVVLALTACQPEGADEGDAIEAVSSKSQELSGVTNHLIEQSSSLTRQAYDEASKGWLRWMMKQPYSTGPVTDQTGASCGIGQVGLVWNLAGTEGGAVTRNCTIPKNRLLFFPLINEWIIPQPGDVDTAAEMTAFKAFVVEYFAETPPLTCNLKLKLDGQDVLPFAQLKAKQYVDVIKPFPIQVNDDNWASAYGVQGGAYPAAFTDGYFALMLPLSPGQHTLEFGGAFCDEGTPFFETSVTYNLTVATH